jgi:hypothetical protein
MRTLIFLPLLIGAAFFVWQWMLSRRGQAVSARWLGRALLALAVGVVVTLALFVLSSQNSWRVW